MYEDRFEKSIEIFQIGLNKVSLARFQSGKSSITLS